MTERTTRSEHREAQQQRPQDSGRIEQQPGATEKAPPAALLPDPTRPVDEQSPETLLAMCLFGEARGEPEAARRAVAQVAVNRAKFPHAVFGSRKGADFSENLRRVILQPEQFSCFAAGDPNRAKLLRPLAFGSAATWQSCVAAARQALDARDEQDAVTANSDHYFDRSIQPPPWADPSRQTVQIGRLCFFRLYLPPSEAGSDARRPAAKAPLRNSSAVPGGPSPRGEGTTAVLRQEESGSGPP